MKSEEIGRLTPDAWFGWRFADQSIGGNAAIGRPSARWATQEAKEFVSMGHFAV
jgi:hypothetical protein